MLKVNTGGCQRKRKKNTMEEESLYNSRSRSHKIKAINRLKNNTPTKRTTCAWKTEVKNVTLK